MAGANPTFSESWYRVATLRPRLRATVQTRRQHFRGQIWHIIQDPANNSFFRLHAAAYRFVALLDGRRTVADAWRSVQFHHGRRGPDPNRSHRRARATVLGQPYPGRAAPRCRGTVPQAPQTSRPGAEILAGEYPFRPHSDLRPQPPAGCVGRGRRLALLADWLSALARPAGDRGVLRGVGMGRAGPQDIRNSELESTSGIPPRDVRGDGADQGGPRARPRRSLQAIRTPDPRRRRGPRDGRHAADLRAHALCGRVQRMGDAEQAAQVHCGRRGDDVRASPGGDCGGGMGMDGGVGGALADRPERGELLHDVHLERLDAPVQRQLPAAVRRLLYPL